MNLHRGSRILSGLCLCFCGGGLLLFPAQVSAGVLEGAEVCLHRLLPSLFPFMVLSSVAVRMDLAHDWGRIFSPVMEKLYRLPGCCSAPLLLGAVGGYPTGAATAIRLYQSGQCTKEEAQRLLAFCSLCGPAFMIGAVGDGLLGSAQLGGILYLIHLFSALLTGLFFRGQTAPTPARSKPGHQTIPFSSVFTRSVTDGLESILRLSAFVICFSALNALLRAAQILPLLSRPAVPFLGTANAQALITGLLEMTGGIFSLTDAPGELHIPLAAFLMGWGGLCVHMQVLSLMEDTDLSPALYLKGKAIHAVLCLGLTLLVLWGETLWCLLGGGLLLFFPKHGRKKVVEKEAQVYYNGGNRIRTRKGAVDP